VSLTNPPIEVRKGPGGESAYIKGTRTRVSDILRMFDVMRDEVIIERICRALPHLTPDQVRAALEYGRGNQAVEDEIREEESLLREQPAK
jgi:uncharacterized protein (DUF433 family)